MGATGAVYAASGSRPPGRYAVITPVRDELDSIGRLRTALEAQTIRPHAWYIVDTGSGDGTLELASSFAQQLSWIECHSIDGGSSRQRGGPVVHALEQGLCGIGDSHIDIVVKVDADVTMGATYFASILAGFEADPRLGMASGPPGAARRRVEADATDTWVCRGAVSLVSEAVPRGTPSPGEEPRLGRHR